MKIQILDVSLCIIEQLIMYIFFNTVFKKRFKSILPLIFVILIISSVSLICSKLNVIVRSVISVFSIAASCKILYKDKIYVHTALVITVLYILSIIDIVFGNLFSLCFSAQFLDVFYSKFSYRLVFCLIIKAVDIACIAMIRRFFAESGLTLKKDVWILFNVVMSAFLFFTVSYIILYPGSSYSSESSIFFFITSSSFFIMSFIVIYFITRICASFNYEKKVYLLESNYAMLRDNMAFQNSSSEKIKKSQHDMRSHIMTVKTLLENGNIPEAEQLLNELEKQVNSIKIELSESTGNPLIDAVILQNAAVCESKHIKFSYKLTALPNLNISEADLSSVLSNLLNNAVEAAEKTENPFIELSAEVYKSFLSVSVKNSCCHAAAVSSGGLVTSKDDKEAHGYGTQIIKDITSKYCGEYLWEAHSTYFWASVLLNLDCANQ